VVQCLRVMTREEGYRGWFKGNWTNVLRIAPYSALQFWSFEQYKRVRGNMRHFS